MKTDKKVLENALSDFEQKIGQKLPKEYRSFLEKNRGHDIEGKEFDIPQDENISLIHVVYGLVCEDEYDNLVNMIDVFKGQLQNWLIPIACDPFGNQVCISILKENVGSIWYWEKDRGTPATLYELSTTFNKFTKGLKKSLYDDGTVAGNFINIKGIEKLVAYLDSGYDLEEEDKLGKTLIERAARKNRLDIVKVLVERGAKLKTSHQIALKNYKFFPKFEEMVNYFKEIEADSKVVSFSK